MPRRDIRRERGIALVIVLWALVLLSAIAAGFATTTRTEIHIARNRVANAQAQALADAGVYWAIANLTDPVLKPGWKPDGTIHALPFGESELQISIQDEGGKIDLNTAADPLLAGLFQSVGLGAQQSDALVDAIVDWRDEDNLRRLNGAEDRDYLAAGSDFGAKDGPFVTVEELLQVKGVTQTLFKRVAPVLTVFSRRSGVDPLTASRAALHAVPGIDTAMIDAILAARASGDDDGGATPMPDLSAISANLSRASGKVFTVLSVARTAGGAEFVREAVVRLARDPKKPFGIHVWKQGAPAAEPPPDTDQFEGSGAPNS